MDTKRCVGDSEPVLGVDLGESGRLRPANKSPWLAVVLIPGALLWVGCTKGWVRESRLAPTGLASEDAIAIIWDRSMAEQYSRGLEDAVTRCIKSAVEEVQATMRIVSPDDFRKVAFPDLAQEEILPSGASWEQLLDDPVFRQRIAPLGLRYLIAVSGSELSRDIPVDSAFGGGGGYGGGFFALVLNWKTNHYISMSATIMDLPQTRVAGTVSAQATGESSKGVALFYLVLPVPYAVPSGGVTSRACGELGEGVANFLSGGTMAIE